MVLGRLGGHFDSAAEHLVEFADEHQFDFEPESLERDESSVDHGNVDERRSNVDSQHV